MAKQIPTSTAIPSAKVEDIRFNAQTLDEIINDDAKLISDRFSRQIPTIREFYNNLGYILIQDFNAGATLTKPNEALLWDTADGGDGEYYRWDGALPKVVAPASTPATSGGVGAGFWLGVGEAALRSELAQTDSQVSIAGETAERVSKKKAFEFLTIDDLLNADWISVGDRCNTDERSTGNGGGGEHIAIATGVTPDVDLPNGQDIIQSIANPLISFKLRVKYPLDLRTIGLTGSGDETAILARGLAISLHCIYPEGAGSNFTSALTIQQSGKLEFVGGQRAGTLNKTFSGTGITLSSLAEIYNPNIDAQTNTGTVIDIPSGFSQRIYKARIVNPAGSAVKFGANAGGGAIIDGLEGHTTDAATYDFLDITEDTVAVPRFISKLWFGGDNINLSGGGNGTVISNFYVGRIKTGVRGATKTTLAHISNGRIAGGGASRTYTMDDCDISNVAIAEAVTLDDCQGYNLVNVSMNSFTENSNCRFGHVSEQLREFSTVWDQASGTPQPSIGDGAIKMTYTRSGTVCTVNLRLVIGSTTVTGNSGAAWRFSLPYPSSIFLDTRGLIAIANDGGTTDYTIAGTIAADSNILTFGYSGQSLRSDYPFVWASGDTLDAQFTYTVK